MKVLCGRPGTVRFIAEPVTRRGTCLRSVIALLVSYACVFATTCNRGSNPIAVIPRSCGTVLWEPEHAGAAHVAKRNGFEVYWNAPPREDDVEGQIALLNRVVDRKPPGIILTPDETLPLRTPVRRIVDRGVPMVVIGTHLGVAPSTKLSYVLNDDEAGGQIAAERLGRILNGVGTIAVVGVNPQLTGITQRESSLERTLAQEFPKIQVVARRLGHYSVPQEQQITEDLINAGAPLDAIVALSSSSTRGAYYALVEFRKVRTVKLVGFDQDLIPPIRTGGIDSIVMQRTYDMGHVGMSLLLSEMKGKPVPGVTVLPPLLMTRENVDSAEITGQLTAKWWSEE